jgi:hypothetical protein
MTILTVGPSGQEYTTLTAAVAASHAGDVIQVQAGTYTNDFPATISHNLTIEGIGGLVNLVATVPPPNGKAILDVGTSGITVTLDNIEFSGASVADGNGAGIRYEGGNLIINDCYFHNNQDGILGAPDPAGTITITNSEFANNGSGTGFTHNIYIGSIAQFTITGSLIEGAVVGHEIKSRALVNVITNNRIVDGPTGTASYSIDLPNGGNNTITGNTIEKGPMAQNPSIIAVAEEAVYAGSSLTIANNTILNDNNSSTRVVFNPASTPVTFTNNSLFGLTSAQISNNPITSSGTTFLSTEPTYSTAPPYVTLFPVGTAIAGAMTLNAATEHVTLASSTKVATFTDTNSGDTAAGFTAQINWGDGTPLTTGTVSGSNGSFSVTGGHTYGDEGSDPASVTITRISDGLLTTLSGAVAIGENDHLAGTGTSFSATAGKSFSGVVASFSNTDLVTPASDLVATINWGDGTATTGGVVGGSGGAFTVSGAHTYATAGTDAVTTVLSDDAPGTAMTSAVSTAHVASGIVSPDTLVLLLSTDTPGSQFIASLDGTQIGAAQPISALHGGLPESFSFTGSFGAGVHTLTLDVLSGSSAPGAAVPDMYVAGGSYDSMLFTGSATVMLPNLPVSFTIGLLAV